MTGTKALKGLIEVATLMHDDNGLDKPCKKRHAVEKASMTKKPMLNVLLEIDIHATGQTLEVVD